MQNIKDSISTIPSTPRPIVRRNSAPTLTVKTPTDSFQTTAYNDAPGASFQISQLQAFALLAQIRQTKATVSQPPKHFYDRISRGLMYDPVHCSDGWTYDRKTAQHLVDNGLTAPLSEDAFYIYGPDRNLRRAIWDAYPKQHEALVRFTDSTYTGSIDAVGMPHGQGERSFCNRTVEKGLFYNGALQNGIRVLGNGDKVEGAFVDGKLSGEGVRRFASGDKRGQIHAGHFEAGELNGSGVITYPSGDRYVGPIADGKAYGQGVLTSANGYKYEGAVENGQAHGQGVLSSTYATYIGMFVKGEFHGQGILTLPDGTVFDGAFENMMFQGHGSLTLANGDRRVGMFRDGRLQGLGTVIEDNCVVSKGNFVDDKLHGQGSITFADGSTYDGEFENGLAHGQGLFACANGDNYAGAFESTKQHGEGVFTWANGARYAGAFVQNVMHGQGTFTWPNSSDKFVGQFMFNRRVLSTSSETTFLGRWWPLPKLGPKEPQVVGRFTTFWQKVKNLSHFCSSWFQKILPEMSTCSQSSGRVVDDNLKIQPASRVEYL